MADNLFLFFTSVGNKNDDPSRKQVDTQDALRFGESVGVPVFETSAKENINVEEVCCVRKHIGATTGKGGGGVKLCMF